MLSAWCAVRLPVGGHGAVAAKRTWGAHMPAMIAEAVWEHAVPAARKGLESNDFMAGGVTAGAPKSGLVRGTPFEGG